ncbi:MAG TPA: polysaccharide deacetylase family protein [Blastocatellia bacterium]|nr:polysaccharide deacetylase family protein [Blastocatellia bacterium]
MNLMKRSVLVALLVVVAATNLPAREKPTAHAAPKEVCVTFDDLPLNGPDMDLKRLRAMTVKLLGVIKAHNIPVVGFVNERKLYRLGEMDERVAILKLWLDNGFELGNHTYSHPSLQTTPLAAFEEDLIRGETVTRMLMERRGLKLRYFRHPFLRTGPTLEARASFEKFLAERGYTVAPVTFDDADYMFNTVYVRARERNDAALVERTSKAYLEHMQTMVDFFEKLSLEVVGAPVRHVLLLHANELNADYFDGVARMFEKRGYQFVTLARALEDPAYRLPDTYAGPRGVSWLHRWAYSKGMKQTLKAEPDPPDFIQKLYNEATAGQ